MSIIKTSWSMLLANFYHRYWFPVRRNWLSNFVIDGLYPRILQFQQRVQHKYIYLMWIIVTMKSMWQTIYSTIWSHTRVLYVPHFMMERNLPSHIYVVWRPRVIFLKRLGILSVRLVPRKDYYFTTPRFIMWNPFRIYCGSTSLVMRLVATWILKGLLDFLYQH